MVTVSSISLLQDWLDIDFGIAEGVDFIAVSFVKSAEVIKHLKSYIKARARDGYEPFLASKAAFSRTHLYFRIYLRS